jgi:hypothetical protein
MGLITLREEHILRMPENMMLRRIFGPRREEMAVAGEDYRMRSFITCTHHQILLR